MISKISWQFVVGSLVAGLFYALAAWTINWSGLFMAYNDAGDAVALILVAGVMIGVGVALMVAGRAQELFEEVVTLE